MAKSLLAYVVLSIVVAAHCLPEGFKSASNKLIKIKEDSHSKNVVIMKKTLVNAPDNGPAPVVSRPSRPSYSSEEDDDVILIKTKSGRPSKPRVPKKNITRISRPKVNLKLKEEAAAVKTSAEVPSPKPSNLKLQFEEGPCENDIDILSEQEQESVRLYLN